MARGRGGRCKFGGHKKVSPNKRGLGTPGEDSDGKYMISFEMLGPEYDVSTGRMKVCVRVGKVGPNSNDLGKSGGKGVTFSIIRLRVEHCLHCTSLDSRDNQRRQNSVMVKGES